MGSYLKYTNALLWMIFKKTISTMTQKKNMFAQFITTTFIYIHFQYCTGSEKFSSLTCERQSTNSKIVMS